MFKTTWIRSPFEDHLNVKQLNPSPTHWSQFAWSHHVTVPDEPGCYVLATYAGEVLYVGMATGSIRNRMGNHLNTPTKRAGGPSGLPFWFYYILRTGNDIPVTERGWMNQAILQDGEMPPLNRIYSPL